MTSRQWTFGRELKIGMVGRWEGGKVGSNRVGFVAALLVFHSAHGLQAGLSIKLQMFNQGHGQKSPNLDLLTLG